MKKSIREENSVTNIAPTNPADAKTPGGTMTVNTNNATPAPPQPTATSTSSGTEGNTLASKPNK